MISYEMDDIRAGALRIPGGWLAQIPELIDPAYTEALTAYYYQTYSRLGTEAEARSWARAIQVRLGGGEFVQRLRAFIRRQATTYSKRFPDLVREDGTLQGFRPESLQRAFVPYDKPGRRGKAALRGLLAGMARDARGS